MTSGYFDYSNTRSSISTRFCLLSLSLLAYQVPLCNLLSLYIVILYTHNISILHSSAFYQSHYCNPSNHQTITNMKTTKNQSLLSRLKTVVNKVRFLLSSAVLSRTWQIASVIRRASSLPSPRQLSFSDRMPSTGLTMICNSDEVTTTVNTSPAEASNSGSSNRLVRTVSYDPYDDIDKRAEMFINNFRRQLQMERQISLQLRYCRTDSFELSP